MEEHRLTELLRRRSAEVSGQTRFCPETEVLVKYFEGCLNEKALSSLKHHLVGCRFCLAQVGNLERLANRSIDLDVKGAVLADAKRLFKPVLPKSTRNVPVWAATAVVVLAMFTISTLGPRSGDVPATIAAGEQPMVEPRGQFRSIDSPMSTPKIISPVEGEQIKSNELTVRWTEVQGSLHYDVRVVTAEGFIVWNNRVEGTEWKPPIDQPLESGMAYFVRVDAYLAEANSVSSDHILFTMEERKQ